MDNNFIIHQYSINKTVDLVKLSLNEIKAIDKTIGYRELTNRKAPANYKELCKLYNDERISNEEFKEKWIEEEERITIC